MQEYKFVLTLGNQLMEFTTSTDQKGKKSYGLNNCCINNSYNLTSIHSFFKLTNQSQSIPGVTHLAELCSVLILTLTLFL